MLRVLLVDDEYLVLKGLEAMLTGVDALPMELYTALDALDALEKLPAVLPDVVIADINMPEMDGLAMIDEIRRRGFDCRFLILSGHENLEYLKTAIKYQVVDYLLKPVNKELLLERLQGLDLDREKRQDRTLFRVRMNLLYNEPLDALVTERDILALLPEERLCICLIDQRAMTDDMSQQLGYYFERILSFRQRNLSVFLLGFRAALPLSVVRDAWRVLGDGTSLAVGVSPIWERRELIDSLYDPDKPSLYLYALVDLLRNLVPSAQASERLDPIPVSAIYAVLKGQAEVDSLFASLHEVPEEALRDYFSRLYADTVACDLFITGNSVDAETILANYVGMHTLIIDHEAFRNTASVMMTNPWNANTIGSTVLFASGYSEKISQAVCYIERNYRKDLSLDLMADYVDLHPSYLSHVFKKEVGISFLSYLHKVRIREACRIFRERPRLQVERVAEKVGYHTPAYFHRVFRSQMGESPNKWRQHNQ